MFKKVLCVFLSALFMLGMLGTAAFAKTSEEADTHLQYNEDGKFTIMQISDIQDFFFMRAPTKALLKAELEANPCDLIVLTGDNISSSSLTMGSANMAIWQFMSVFEELGTPVVITFGNHDDERTLADKKLQLRMYEQYDCFIGCAGEDFGDTNLCTYYVPIYASDNAYQMKNVVWMIDSGTYNTENDRGGYACTTKAQIDWYKTKSAELEEKYGEKIPGFMFQHIVVPEIWDALVEGEDTDPNGCVWHDGKCLVLPEGSKGRMGEGPCPPNYSNGQFAAAVERGDIMAMFFGHDHTNTYEIYDYQGIDLINTPGVGFNSYNSDDVGVRMIYLDESDPWSYETEVVSYFDLFDYDDDAARYLYKSDSSTVSDETHFAAFFKWIFACIKNFLSLKWLLG